MFTAAAENHTAPVPADPEATGPIPAAPPAGRVARQSVEPPAEPAPWPGFAHDEPSGSAPQSQFAPVPAEDLAAEPATVSPDGLAAEPRSWFEPAQPAAPGHQNGATDSPVSGESGETIASPEPGRPNGAAAPSGQPHGDEPVPDRWSDPSFPRIDPRLPAGFQDRR